VITSPFLKVQRMPTHLDAIQLGLQYTF